MRVLPVANAPPLVLPADPLAGLGERRDARTDAQAVLHLPSVLTLAECDRLLDVFLTAAVQDAGTVLRLPGLYLGGWPSYEAQHGVRAPAGLDGIPEHLGALVAAQNAAEWQFSLFLDEGMPPVSPIFEIECQAPGRGATAWRCDFTLDSPISSPGPKLTLLVELSQSSEHDGGAPEVFDGLNIVRHSMQVGDALLFPAFFVQRRPAITRGVRLMLLGQVWGPHFR